MHERAMTVAEALTASAVCALALVITVAYLWARVSRLSTLALLGIGVFCDMRTAVRSVFGEFPNDVAYPMRERRFCGRARL